MTTSPSKLAITLLIVLFHLQANKTLALSSDGIALLSFKYSILSDPLSALGNWNYNDQTPCGWSGVTCSGDLRVTAVTLSSSALLGSISPDLGTIDTLQRLELSGNLLNGTLSAGIFNASELQYLSLAGNLISGEIPVELSNLKGLTYLNLSDNAFTGKVPESLASLPNLTLVCLKSNFLFGAVPSGLSKVEFLDLSSNLLNVSLPADFGGEKMKYLNLSYNKIPGKIPADFAELIPSNATIDLSFNGLVGPIPESSSLLSQRQDLFAGNPELCGKPLKSLCNVPSSLSTPPNVSSSSTPAIAAIPKTIDSGAGAPATNDRVIGEARGGLKPATIAGIAAADLAGIAILAAVILYVHRVRKRRSKRHGNGKNDDEEDENDGKEENPKAWSCIRSKFGEAGSDVASSNGSGSVVTVDGERPELEIERLLKASAYVVGASNESIVYKAVLEDGSALAVRRIGRTRDEKMRDFEANVRLFARLRHQNVLRLRGFYWGHDEKLLVSEFVSNGSLASSGNSRRGGSSPLHQPLEVRIRIARGIARGLSYIHEKKHVHGNIKPSNILLTSDMEPIISDLGLDRLIVSGNNIMSTIAHKPSGSARYFGSLRSNPSREIDHEAGSTGGSVPAGPSSTASSPYRAPESSKSVKPSPKWDVFSFGVILLELLTGRVFSDQELGSSAEDKGRVLRLVDVAIRAEAESKEEAVVASLKLGFSCASFVPRKRPTMKEALQVLEKFPYHSS